MAWWIRERTRRFLRANPKDAIDAARATGELFWKMDNLQCTNCGKITMVWSSIKYNYCPHCGAHMRDMRDYE